MPEQTDQRALEPLEEFLLEQTSRLEFLDPNSPQYKSLKDALLVAESMQFIKDNEELIKRIIDCKNNKQAYLADEYIKSHYADRAEQDFENKVLRALNGVSFHIDYQSPELGWQALAGLVYQFETAIVTAREQNVTDELINKLRYDRDRGCIEERVSNALLYAGRLLSGEVSFDDEFARVYEQLSTTRQTEQEKYSLALWHFASNDLLGKDVIINKTTRDILVAGGIAVEQFAAFLDTQGGLAYKFKLTPEIIKSYLIAMGELSESFTSADDYKKTIYQEVYAEKDVDIVLGKANPPMLQHRFKDYDDAIKFLQWLQSEPELKEVGILKAKVTEESGQFVIRLSGEQVDKIL